MNILNVYDNLNKYSKLAEKLARGRDYAIGSDGWLEIGDRSIARVGIGDDGKLYQGRFFNQILRWEEITIGKLGAMVSGLKNG